MDEARIHQVRDRTLVLRVLVPGLETRLRDKMKEAEEAAASKHQKPGGTNADPKDVLQDLDGVTLEPTKNGKCTLWNFHCDGATYPARLVNLPCPVELHKTHDHAMYYKSVDIGQMFIVYEDRTALEEAEAVPKSEGFPSYHHSGLTPPMKRVVERRFETREHKALAPPKHEVGDVEIELQGLLERISKDASGRSKAKPKVPATATKVVEEVVEDIVDYEPWMDDNGRQPTGVEFDDTDNICKVHPELWLDPEEIAAIKLEEAEKEKAEAEAAAAAAEAKKKKEAKKEKKAKKKAKQEEEEGPSTKKGIPAKKHREEVDDVAQAAAQMSHELDADEILGAALDDSYFDFDDDEALAGLEF